MTLLCFALTLAGLSPCRGISSCLSLLSPAFSPAQQHHVSSEKYYISVRRYTQAKNNSFRRYFGVYSRMKGEPMTEPYNIAPRVQRAFEQSGMTKAQIAQRAEIRWAQLQKILTGQRPQVSAETVRRLALALDVSSDYLLGLADDPAPRRNLHQRQKHSQAIDKDEPAQAMAHQEEG